LSVIVSDPRLDLERNERRFVWHKRRLLRKAYHQATRVIAVSDGVRRAAIGYFRLRPERIVTLPNPVDLERIQRLAADTSLRLEPGLFHVVSVGRLHPAKGYATLLQAADELVHSGGLRSLRIHLVGAGPLEAELKRFVDERALREHVIFWGFLVNPFPLVRQASLFCLPSIYEGNSNALLEAMACGAPVLASDAPGGMRETLDDGRFGRLVPPGDAQALAEAIRRAMESSDALRATAAAARRHVEEHFRLDESVRRLEALMRECAKG
jgi:glycosyltransferase involved in cell wall biosynthesis